MKFVHFASVAVIVASFIVGIGAVAMDDERVSYTYDLCASHLAALLI